LQEQNKEIDRNQAIEDWELINDKEEEDLAHTRHANKSLLLSI
jgi:hypothetical protein